MDGLETRAFVGRQQELAALDNALETATTGRTTTVLIGGDAGVGKTSLLTRWNQHARDAGARIASGVALDLGEHGPPYAAVTEALRGLLSSVDPTRLESMLGPNRSVLARVIPELGTDAASHSSVGPLAQARIFDRFIDVLDGASTDVPLVLELEDLHWADPSTQAFLPYLLETATASTLLLVCTYRIDEAFTGSAFASTLVQLRRRPGVQMLTVEPFSRTEVHEQLTGILGRSPSNAQLESILDRSEGNALFVEELASSPDPESELPASVAESTAVNAARLAEDTQSVIRAAAVIGRATSDGLLRSVVDLDDPDTDRALREAVHARILEPDHAARGYQFRHALIHQAIYQQTLPGERRRLHAVVASAMAGDREERDQDGALAAQLARHWYEAGDEERAFVASLRAGAATADQSAYEESLKHYQRALDLWGRTPVGRADLSLSGVLADASRVAYLAGEFESSLAYAERAVAELGDAPDPSVQFRAFDQLAQARFGLGGDWVEIAAVIAQLDTAGRPPTETIRILEDRSFSLLDTDRPAALALARETVKLAEAEGDPLIEARATALVADILCVHDPAASEAGLRRALELAIETGDAILEMDIRRNLADTLAYVQDYDGLLVETEAAIDFAERRHIGRMVRPHARYHQAWAQMQLGRLVESLATVGRGLADEPLGGTARLLRIVGAEASTAIGAYADAATHLEAARNPDAIDDLEADRSYFATARAELALAERRTGDVLRFVDASLRHLVGRGAEGDVFVTGWWLAELGTAALADQAEQARAAGDDAEIDLARRSANDTLDLLENLRRSRADAGIPDIGVTAGHDFLIRGHLGRLEGVDEPARWAAAAAAFPSSSVQALTAKYRQAEAMLSVRASKEEVRAVLAPAHETAVAIGARPIADRMAALARRARIDLVRPAVADPSAIEPTRDQVEPPVDRNEALHKRGLSDREIDVLTLIAAGYSNREIGERLFISPKTASVHVTHILDKLGVTTRTEAATIGVRLGLPEVDVGPD